MAIHANSTTAPGFLDLADAVPVSTPDLTPETVSMLDAIGPEAGHEPLLPVGPDVLPFWPYWPPNEPHTAVSEGSAPFPDFSDIRELEGLDAPRRHSLRRVAADAVDHLIALLDALEVESEDFEDGHDAELDFEGEATLGAPEQHHKQTKWAAGWNDHDGEFEPSLGAPERGLYHSQASWAAGSRCIDRDEGEADPGYDLGELDVADEPHDEQEEGNAEPWLGAANNHHNQTDWAQGDLSDCEQVNEDGISTDRDRPRPGDADMARREARDLKRRAEAIRRRKQGRPVGRVEWEPHYISDGAGRLIRVVQITHV